MKYTLQELKELYNNQQLSSRSLISYIKNSGDLGKELIQLTSFLDIYDVDINQRLYHYLNNYTTPYMCPVCHKDICSWSGSITTGYRKSCTNRACKNQITSETQNKEKYISNRIEKFNNWQSSVTSINDQDIIDNIKYDKYIKLIDNPIILDYLNNRFIDSDSLIETVQRIRLHIEKKPTCPYCGKPVKWIGKQSKLYTKYCSTTCRANAPETHQKMKETNIKNWGTAGCYDSEKYRRHLKETIGRETWATNESIQKRANTLLEHYGTTKLYSVPEIAEKIRQTNIERYGSENPYDNDEVLAKYYKNKNERKPDTSKEENTLYELLKQYYPNIKQHYYNKKHPYNVDFYIPEKDLYIEYQGSGYHHYRPFNPDDNDCIKELNRLKELEQRLGNIPNGYSEIIRIWTVKDPEKRQAAKINNINLMEIWRNYNIDNIINEINNYPNI